MSGDLPSTEQLATIAAATDRTLPTVERLREALVLWKEAARFLATERLKADAAKERSARDISECNAENDRRRREAEEYEKDPFGLSPLATNGIIMADQFLKAVLRDGMQLPERFETDPKHPDGPLVRITATMRWRRPQREKALRDYLCGSVRDHNQGTEDDPVFVPRFANGDDLLTAFSENGLPVETAMAFARDFQTIAVVLRELDRDVGRRKGGEATKAKHAETKRERNPKRKMTSWERKTKAPRKK